MLRVEDLTVQFGGNRVLDGVSFECAVGQVTAIIGPNGAGKTTLFDAMTGFARTRSGAVSCEGAELTGLPTFRVARSGVARTFQTPRLFEGMSVLENLIVAGIDGGLPATTKTAFLRLGKSSFEKNAVSDARHWLEFLRLTDKQDNLASQLSGGQRKLVEMGRALMTRPRFVLLDEPVAGVAPALVNEIGERLQSLAATGLGVVVIEHNMDFVMRVSDRVIVLASGKVLTEGTADHVRSHPEVLEAYLGGA